MLLYILVAVLNSVFFKLVILISLCANVCSWLYPLQRNMATARETVESQADREMEAEERIDFLGMFERVWMIIQWDCSPLGWCSVTLVI